eukprot:6180748-Pleurochrysis_carterae.AAC.2
MTDVTFPPSFAWGAATAAFQIEGGADEGGKGLSIWDAFARAPGRIKTGEDGRNGAGHFYKWRADVKLMAQVCVDAPMDYLNTSSHLRRSLCPRTNSMLFRPCLSGVSIPNWKPLAMRLPMRHSVLSPLHLACK